jgi:hypothetical protein
MPSIIEYKPTERFPYQFVSPISYRPRFVFYSSIIIDREQDDKCIPCAYCGNPSQLEKLIQEQADRYQNFNQSFIQSFDPVTVGSDSGGPPFSINWQTTVNNPCSSMPWTISQNNTSIRYTIIDSANCGGPCNALQSGTATATITTGSKDVNMFLQFSGIGEYQDPNYELISFYLNGILLASGNAAGGQLGCANGPIIQQIFEQPPYFLQKNTTYVFFIDFTTNDGLFHIGCFYQIDLSFLEL